MYKNQKIKNRKTEIFCYGPAKQEHSPAWMFFIYKLN